MIEQQLLENISALCLINALKILVKFHLAPYGHTLDVNQMLKIQKFQLKHKKFPQKESNLHVS
jgi:hypothetical protein